MKKQVRHPVKAGDGGTIDIETFAGLYRSYADNMYEVSLIEEIRAVKVASFSFKPLHGKPYTRGFWQYSSYKAFVKDLHRICSTNSFIIGHNAKKFDLRHLNTFFAKYGLPNTNIHVFDTKNEVKKHFKLPSYSLKYVLVAFKLGYKIETGGDILWQGAEKGVKKDRATFLEYNENDTVQTEKLFLFLLDNGWIKNPPGEKIYKPGHGCWRCKTDDTQKRGMKPRVAGMVQEYLCKHCGQRLYTDVLYTWEEFNKLKNNHNL